ncbi:MAG: 4-(cytidine 5'-diphospho)-2-C-methyl-D-erythritol kinase [Bacillota bacterium]
MEKYIFAPAKVNVSLDVKARRNDGYHEIDSLMASVSWGDWLGFSEAEAFSLVTVPEMQVLPGENIVTRAAELLSAETGREFPVRILLEKNLPVAAGLAGGSADAAAALHGLNQFFTLGLKEGDLIEIGARLGSDVPFCIKGGVCRVGGRGERLTAVDPFPDLWMVLVTPAEEVSTACVYGRFDALSGRGCSGYTAKSINACRFGDAAGLAGVWGNDLELVTLELYPEVKRWKSILALREEALGVLMSGSGPTLICLVAGEEKGKRLLGALELPAAFRSALVEVIRPDYRFVARDVADDMNGGRTLAQEKNGPNQPG